MFKRTIFRSERVLGLLGAILREVQEGILSSPLGPRGLSLYDVTL